MAEIAYPRAAWSDWPWRWPVVVLLATVFFVPMQRYELPVTLPIHLEPYRPLVALVFASWFLSLLMMDARFRRTSLDAPILLLLVAVGFSLAANPARFAAYQAEALKFVSMFLTFVATYYLFVSVVRREEEIEFVVRAIVSFGAVVAFFAIIESRTGFSPFAHLQTLLPILRELPAELTFIRDGRVRAFGTAEHPIALGALFVMMAPFAVYLYVSTRRLLWLVCFVVLVVGALSTVSRTAVLMLVVVLIAFAAVRWHDVRRYWILILPVVAVVHFLIPGTLGAIRGSFIPTGGLVAEQSENATSASSSGRLSDVAPALEEFQSKPLLGSGMGTRVTVGQDINGRLLDNQWLGLLIDAGLAGTLAFVWLAFRFARQQFALARARRGPPGYLPLACAAAVTAYGIGMLTYDSFSFEQVTFAFFMVLAIGSSLRLLPEVPPSPAARRSKVTRARAVPVALGSLQSSR